MPRQGLLKCSSYFFIVFLMCPRRIRPIDLKTGNQEYSRAVRKSLNDGIHKDLVFRRGDWYTNIVRQTDEELLKQSISFETLPNLDLTDQRMKELKLWPGGIVPYYIDVISFDDKVLRDRIRMYLNGINAITMLNFVEIPSPPTNENDRWVFFSNRRGQLQCADHSTQNLTTEGTQLVILGYDCMSVENEMAEAVLSIAGVPLQHNAPDRDTYIKIVDKNIIPEKKYLFQKMSDSEWVFTNHLKYDFTSANHFHQHKHSINGRATIELQEPFEDTTIGDSRGLSHVDIIKLRMLYNGQISKQDKVSQCSQLFHKDHTSMKNMPFRYDEREDFPTNSLQQTGSSTKEDNSKDNETGDGLDDATPPATRKMNRKRRRVKGIAKNYKDPLSYLSDYQTGDEHRRNSVQKTKKKYINKI